MKTIFVSLSFVIPGEGNKCFIGLVKAKIINNKAVVSPSKIFKTVFGYELPVHSIIFY